jgi:hypothetical protein
MRNPVILILTWIIFGSIGMLGGNEYQKWVYHEEAKKVASYCTDQKLDAYLAKDGADYVCFKQNSDTKRISKSLIVIE